MSVLAVSSASEDETRAIAARLADTLVAGDVVALSGPLGAGKTAFVRGLAERLGLAAGERVSSPSYALVNDYALGAEVRGALRLVHLDLYRLEGDEALEALGFSELSEGAIVVVEWPEHAPAALAEATVHVVIADRGGERRELTITRAEPRPEAGQAAGSRPPGR